MIKENKKEVAEVKFSDYEKSVPELLNKTDFKKIIKEQKRIFLKPNLTLCKYFPTTTEVRFTEQVVKYIRKHNKKAELIIAEGSGGCETEKCFEKLGYNELSDKYNVPILDLNETELTRVQDERFKKFNFIEYPAPLLTGFLISLPVLKEHSKTTITISLKNMLGAYPSSYYKEPENSWKNIIHKFPIEFSIHDILVCKFPDYAICDASIVQLEHEINGYNKELGILLAGDPLELDKKGALLLGHNWKNIKHLVLADELKNDKFKTLKEAS